MKQPLAFLGLAGACSACCAAPALLPLLVAGVAGTAWLSPQLALSSAAVLVLVAFGFALLRKAKAAKLGAKRSCGCRIEQEQR